MKLMLFPCLARRTWRGTRNNKFLRTENRVNLIKWLVSRIFPIRHECSISPCLGFVPPTLGTNLIYNIWDSDRYLGLLKCLSNANLVAQQPDRTGTVMQQTLWQWEKCIGQICMAFLVVAGLHQSMYIYISDSIIQAKFSVDKLSVLSIE